MVSLKTVKLSGFKSFVTATKIPFKSPLTGIVGPNGCGKSNIIDAIRWVIGESSAKYLRGAQISDVIFKGSDTHAPVAQASVELLFDNRNQLIAGSYAAYPELSVKRRINREGVSTYYLNSSRCRRKDVIDIFLGTGLGPRSYAIIEQGTISQIIEAKPEELRVRFEQIAGIAKYRERRRETEQRMQSTRDNLDRLNDLRDELDKQSAHLKKQANVAQRYNKLKAQQLELQQRVQLLRYAWYDQIIQDKQSGIKDVECQLTDNLSQQSVKTAKADQVKTKKALIEGDLEQQQAEFLRLSTEITAFEHKRSHHHQLVENLQKQIAELEVELVECRQRETDDLSVQDELSKTIDGLAVAAEQGTEKLTEASQAFHLIKTTYDQQMNQIDKLVGEQRQLSESKLWLDKELGQLTKQVTELEDKQSQWQQKLTEIDLSDLEATIVAEKSQLAVIQKKLADASEAQEKRQLTLSRTKDNWEKAQQEDATQLSKIHQAEKELSTLSALQQAALGQQNEDAITWLTEKKLSDYPRLAQQIEVSQGWEKAVETVLGSYLEAICVDNFDDVGTLLEQPPKSNVMLINKHTLDASSGGRKKATTLLSKIKTEFSLVGLLSGVYAISDLNEALAFSATLNANESVITPEGIWMSKYWVRIANKTDLTSGVLAREQSIVVLTKQLNQLNQDKQSIEKQLAGFNVAVKQAESELVNFTKNQGGIKEQQSEIISKLTTYKERYQQQAKQQTFIMSEQALTDKQLKESEAKQKQINLQLTQSAENQQQHDTVYQHANERLLDLQSQYDQEQSAYQLLKEKDQQLSADLTMKRYQLEQKVLTKSHADTRQLQLTEKLNTSHQALERLVVTSFDEAQLQDLLNQRIAIETELRTAKQNQQDCDQQLHAVDIGKNELLKIAETLKQQLTELQLAEHEAKIRQDSAKEALAELGGDFTELSISLDSEESIESVEINLANYDKKLQGFGLINLAAIDEYQRCCERQTYLQEQHDDISLALNELSAAIDKINQETKQRFRKVFDQVNQNFTQLFPQVFGGGKASLRLNSDDLLVAGIEIMAQPPGKCNATIHMLSGGEKALVALSLIFSLFEVNPAPFCLLDEVDAPLDDANIERFCRLVKQMASRVQFIFITHNKATMTMAEDLLGVTMREPGVSRVVSVDVEKAVAYIE